MDNSESVFLIDLRELWTKACQTPSTHASKSEPRIFSVYVQFRGMFFCCFLMLLELGDFPPWTVENILCTVIANLCSENQRTTNTGTSYAENKNYRQNQPSILRKATNVSQENFFHRLLNLVSFESNSMHFRFT